MKTTAIILFLATYASLLIFPKVRAYIAIASAAIFVLVGILPIGSVFFAVDWNVILMIAGSMGVVSLFIGSHMPELLADRIIDKMPNVKWAIISLALFAGIISSVVDNVATVLMVAPVALTIARKLNISPIPGVIAIAVSSNLQGAATLVGDTTAILLGGYANLDFSDFFFYQGKMGMFFVVQLGALVSTFVLLIIFRKENSPINPVKDALVKDYFPSYLLVGMVALLVIASFIPEKPVITNGLICIGLFLVGILRLILLNKDTGSAIKAFQEIDIFTILLLAGLFVVIAGITEVGLVDDISKLFVSLSNDNLFVIFTLLVWASVVFSAFIDNIPYVATMLPVVTGIATIMQIDPTILYFGLLSGATLGGNLTPIGASANIAALGVLRKEGHQPTTWQFMKIGVPFTLSAVLVGYLAIWFIWS